MNVWRGMTARIMSWLLLLSVVTMVACSDDDDASAADVTVNFEAAAQSVREIDEAATVLMKLSGAASRDGVLTFSIETTAGYGTDYTTNPRATDNNVVVPVVKGQTAVKFNVFPVNNSILSGDRTIKITLTESTTGFRIGEKSTQTITLVDDEGPSKLNFAVSEGTLASSEAEGRKVVITLSSKAPSAGTVKVSIASTGATYGTQYTTSPAAADNSIEVPVAAGATEASFTVLPGTVAADVDVTFTLASATGGVELGSLTAYKLTLSPSNTITVTNLRAMFKGTAVTIAEELTLTGVVISTKDNINGSNLWLHDGVRGVMVRFAAAHSFTQGDKISIKINGAVLSEFNNVLQLGSDSKLPLANATKIGTGDLPAYQKITIVDLNTKFDELEGERVQIDNVHFPNADGTLTLAANSGNINIADAANVTSILRTESNGTFRTNVQPLGTGTLYGIVNEYRGAAQISPQTASDIFESNTTATLTITVATTPLAFGDVANGNSSTAKSFAISATNLTADVTVTAPANYTVSDAEAGTYSSSITVTAATAMAGVTVYAKFTPTSGSNQKIDGNINVSSTGAAAQNVAVTGNETGNVATALLVNESFDYGTVDNADITALTANWTRHSGTTGPQYLAAGLSYTGYPNTGGAISFSGGSGGSGDINRAFTPITTDNTIYVSFLVNLSSANATQDYFFHIGPNPLNNTFKARVYAKISGAGWSTGLSKSSDAGVSDNTELSFNRTYLFVLKYVYNAAAATDDQVTLHIYENGIPASEGAAKLVTVGATGDGVNGDVPIGAVAVRQGGNTPNGKIDGIRVALSWADLFN